MNARDLSPKQKALFRIRRFARRSAGARLGGYMSAAQRWDDEIEKVYREAKRRGWNEDPFVLAEERGRQEADRYKDWYGALDRVGKRRIGAATRGTTKYRRDSPRRRRTRRRR